MYIYAEPGSKVRYLNQNGYDTDRELANKILNTEQIYEVEYVKVGSWYSTVKLKYIEPMFNTVMFEDVVEEKK